MYTFKGINMIVWWLNKPEITTYPIYTLNTNPTTQPTTLPTCWVGEAQENGLKTALCVNSCPKIAMSTVLSLFLYSVTVNS